jgi:hypothetical protein
MPIPLRADFDGVAMRSWAKKSKDGPQARRLLALAAIIESGPIPAVHGMLRCGGSLISPMDLRGISHRRL